MGYGLFKLCLLKQTRLLVNNANISFITSRLYRQNQKDLDDQNSTYDSAKAQLILKMNFRDMNDAKPFLRLSMSTLHRILRVINRDTKIGFCKNRIYYIADRIKFPAPTLSANISRRLFVFTLSATWLSQSLDVLLEMGVPGERIARDLWVLKYHHETIRQRLKLVQDTGMDSLYPWMVRCSDEILNRYIRIKRETKDILGNDMTTHLYLAKRLNLSLEDVEDMCLRVPSLQTIRVTKVKRFLDFLTSEGFELDDIARKIRVITLSQNTIKERIDLLRNMGVSNINILVLCKSKNEFAKYCKKIKSLNQ